MRILITMILTMSVLIGSARACGYDSLPTVIKLQGLMNHIYPDSLHVTGAIWEQQKTGRLPMPDGERIVARGAKRKSLEAKALWQMAGLLHAISAEFRSAQSADYGVSVALVENMLWVQMLPQSKDPKERFKLDTGNPREGDIIVVTDEPVIDVISQGKMTVMEALQTGVIRLYGDPKSIAMFRQDFSNIGGTAMEIDRRALIALMLKRPVAVN